MTPKVIYIDQYNHLKFPKDEKVKQEKYISVDHLKKWIKENGMFTETLGGGLVPLNPLLNFIGND